MHDAGGKMIFLMQISPATVTIKWKKYQGGTVYHAKTRRILLSNTYSGTWLYD